MRLKPSGRRMSAEVAVDAVCPWCGRAEKLPVRVNVQNFQQSGGPRLTTWAVAVKGGSRIVSSHECEGERA